MRDIQVSRKAAHGDTYAYAIIFESQPLNRDEIDSIVAQAVRVSVRFIGVVCGAGERSTSLPIDTLLRAFDAPIHFFPARMFDRLLEVLWDGEHSDILVLGRGRDPRADLLFYLENAGRGRHAAAGSGRAVA